MKRERDNRQEMRLSLSLCAAVVLKLFTAVCFPVLVQSHAGMFPETHAQVTLGRKTEIAGDLVVGVTGIDQHVFYQLQFLLKDIAADGDPFCLPEEIGQIVGIQVQFLRDV